MINNLVKVGESHVILLVTTTTEANTRTARFMLSACGPLIKIIKITMITIKVHTITKAPGVRDLVKIKFI